VFAKEVSERAPRLDTPYVTIHHHGDRRLLC
jgi:hypothetical protein